MQMLTLGSEEGARPGLGLIRAYTRRFPASESLRIPHMGWDSVCWTNPEHPLARELTRDCRFYFVHSYTPHSPRHAIASSEHSPAAAAAKRNVMGTQFHPEKSGPDGLRVYANFVALCA